MLGLFHVVRALEHHVLEQMRKPGAVLALVARPDVVIDGDRDNRDGIVLIQHDAQAVRERVFLDFKWCKFKIFRHINLFNRLDL